MKKKLDQRILNFLAKKGIDTDEKLSDFLEPKIQNMLNPFDLHGMKEAVERIEKAIACQEKIVIYGDYDCDGISACVVLYRFFKSRGIAVDVYIPNRFDDGYGLSFDMIDTIKTQSNPDLMITVDLGVTAKNEVEKIKEIGIDIIVTDHHEPGEEIPSCVVIDPKIPGQNYEFNGLCGAGVALKMVEALDGREKIEEYFDIVSIATIGDIVPLVSENRIIAKLGIDKLSKKECMKSLKFMLENLNLNDVSGTDVAFKIVPRLNASGRMSQGKKVFDFLIEEDDKTLSERYFDILKDNEERLDSISEGVLALEKEMQKIDLANENIILLKGFFHQGVLGILASRICHDYNRPAIIFTETEDGTLKGSGRSLEGIDLHDILSKTSDKLIRFGGHKMAVGVELEMKNFDEVKRNLTNLIRKNVSQKVFETKEYFDIEIQEKDINKEFIEEIKMLEPFGCQNERPVFMLPCSNLNVVQMKDLAFRHYKILTKTGKNIICFNGSKHVETLKSPVKKHLIVELEKNSFKGKTYAQAILKDVFVKEIKIDKNIEKETILSLSNKFESGFFKGESKVQFYEPCNLEKIILAQQNSLFGTIVVVDNKKSAERLSNIFPKLKNFTISHVPLKNKQNTILVSHEYPVTVEDFSGYKTLIFTRSIFSGEKNAFSKIGKVFVPSMKQRLEIELFTGRDVSVKAYNIFRKHSASVKANNIFEWVQKIHGIEGGLSCSQLIFSLFAFVELGFMKVMFEPEFEVEIVENPPKKELSSSQFMNKIASRR